MDLYRLAQTLKQQFRSQSRLSRCSLYVDLPGARFHMGQGNIQNPDEVQLNLHIECGPYHRFDIKRTHNSAAIPMLFDALVDDMIAEVDRNLMQMAISQVARYTATFDVPRLLMSMPLIKKHRHVYANPS